jgi:hypothetical protein
MEGGVRIRGSKINNFCYTDDTMLLAERDADIIELTETVKDGSQN